MDPNEQMGDSGGESPEAQPTQNDDTFYLPADFPDADSLKKGDTITLKVMDVGEDGIEVEKMDGGQEESAEGEGGSTADDLESYMNSGKY
jgi:hypothetical protein